MIRGMLSAGNLDELNIVLDLCRQKIVSMSLHYSEVEEAWYGTIDSVAKSEEIITKTYSFPTVMKILTEHLKSL